MAENSRIVRIEGLDGLRAVSVVVVLLYHLHLNIMIGGYLGVEVFFVISGFLITSILLNEAAQNAGHIDIFRFWHRRILRLFPALATLLIVITILGATVIGAKSSQFRFDILGSLFYFENWYQIYSGGSYFSDMGLPLLRHIWSLSIEEQFYLIWPIIVIGCMRLSRRPTSVLIPATIFLMLVSALLMFSHVDIFDDGSINYLDKINRAYLGTDTRAFGILAGALFSMTNWRSKVDGSGSVILNVSGMLALISLLVLSNVLNARDYFLYHSGFILIDVLTILVIASLVAPSKSWVKTVLNNKFAEYIGVRSYGIYLWHWPIYNLISLDNVYLEITVKLLLTLMVAGISYRFVEVPMRTIGLNKNILNIRPSFSSLAYISAVILFGIIISKSAIVLANYPPYINEIAESLKIDSDTNVPPRSEQDKNDASTSGQVISAKSSHDQNLADDDSHKQIVSQKIEAESLENVSITSIGDSVMKGATFALKAHGKRYLKHQHIIVNAEVSRPFEQAYQILLSYKNKNALGDVVVIHLGTNNSNISKKQFDKVVNLLSDRKLILFLTVKSDKKWACDSVNAFLANNVPKVPNARLLDWNKLSESYPAIFYSDKTHLRPNGAEFYANKIFAMISYEHLIENGADVDDSDEEDSTVDDIKATNATS